MNYSFDEPRIKVPSSVISAIGIFIIVCVFVFCYAVLSPASAPGCRYEISARGLIYTSLNEPTSDGCTIKFIDAGSGEQRRIGGDFIVTKICE